MEIDLSSRLFLFSSINCFYPLEVFFSEEIARRKLFRAESLGVSPTPPFFREKQKRKIRLNRSGSTKTWISQNESNFCPNIVKNFTHIRVRRWIEKMFHHGIEFIERHQHVINFLSVPSEMETVFLR